jgi:AbiV family abortive infection protein
MSHSSPTVSAYYLLRGAWYALEQCGNLLRSAVAVYRSGDHATSIVLAGFAREELGKSRILLERRRQTLAGTSFTVKDIRQACCMGQGVHLVKQRAGQLSVVLQGTGSDAVGQVLRAYMDAAPGTPAWIALRQQVDQLTAQESAAMPQDRHRQRLACLYMEPDDSGTGWCRPQDQAGNDAYGYVHGAVNDYSGVYQRLVLWHVPQEEDELAAAIQAWTDRPAPWPPEWP